MSSSNASAKENHRPSYLQAVDLELEHRRRERAKLPLLDYIPALTRRYQAPRQLSRIAEVFERVRRGETVRAVFNAPPRHGKTTLLQHSVPWLLSGNPALQIAYVSFAQKFAEKKSREIRDLTMQAGVELRTDSQSKQDWRTTTGAGGMWATSIDGPITGEGFNLILLDDLIKDRKTAESPVYREHHWDWLQGTAFTRLEPGASVLATGTRWHTDDVLGRMIEMGWEVINLPAIDEDGRPLWPERYNVEALEEIRRTVNEYNWHSQYLGRPVAKGGRVFQDCMVYKTRPQIVRVAIGVDFAYSTRSHADYSCAVVLGLDALGRCYVLEVFRAQIETTKFATALIGIRRRYPAARLFAYVAGAEKGIVDLFNQCGVHITPLNASEDKLARVQGFANHWNSGGVWVPDSDPMDRKQAWVSEYVDELASFTGTRADVHDDQVDASAGAWSALAVPPFAYDRDQDELLMGLSLRG